MKVIGLTGGVGMGKSTAAEILQGLGWLIIDTDLLARRIVEPGQAALEELKQVFGEQILDIGGKLRRDRLAQIVFEDEERRRRLEGILHPRIRALWIQQIQEARAQGVALATVVIPLLFETHAQAELDAVVCVACRAHTQLTRLRARGWSDDHSQKRLAAQWPAERKMFAADFVVWTEGSLDLHAAQLRRLSERLA